jgi:hypothetical protein
MQTDGGTHKRRQLREDRGDINGTGRCGTGHDARLAAGSDIAVPPATGGPRSPARRAARPADRELGPGAGADPAPVHGLGSAVLGEGRGDGFAIGTTGQQQPKEDPGLVRIEEAAVDEAAALQVGF